MSFPTCSDGSTRITGVAMSKDGMNAITVADDGRAQMTALIKRPPHKEVESSSPSAGRDRRRLN
jgi:hypothetical protein